MRSTIFAIACSAGLIAAGAAFADQPQPAMQAQPISAKQDLNPVTCRGFVHEGMLIRGGECHTQHQWDAIRLRQQEILREFQQRALTNN